MHEKGKDHHETKKWAMHKTLRNGVWLRMQNIFQKSIILKQL